jgi:flagellar export protein FliJ
VKGLPNLIRLHRWRLDEKRRTLAELERLALELDDQERRLAAELVREQAAAAASSEARRTYGAYARSVVERRGKIAESKAEVTTQIEQATAAVQEAFQELKRYEIALETREKAARERAGRLEQAVLDDLGLQVFRRKSQA